MNLSDVPDTIVENGYAVLRNFLTVKGLEQLRAECDNLVGLSYAADGDRLVASKGCVIEPFSIGEQCGLRFCEQTRCDRAKYEDQRKILLQHSQSTNNNYDCSGLEQLLQNPKLQHILHGLLGELGYLFNEQFVVKPPQSHESAFPWHRDAEYFLSSNETDIVGYYSLWIPLDDTNAKNGTLQVLPYGSDPATSNTVPSSVIDCNAGDLILLCHDVWHRSPPNLTDRSRRAYLIQFSQLPIEKPVVGELANPVALAVPVSFIV